jgi:hypothetical protein
MNSVLNWLDSFLTQLVLLAIVLMLAAWLLQRKGTPNATEPSA